MYFLMELNPLLFLFDEWSVQVSTLFLRWDYLGGHAN